MQNRMAVLLCNLKPAKMRGVLSQAMVMCASSPEKVEILDPPSGAVPGDRVSCQGFPGTILYFYPNSVLNCGFSQVQRHHSVFSWGVPERLGHIYQSESHHFKWVIYRFFQMSQ